MSAPRRSERIVFVKRRAVTRPPAAPAKVALPKTPSRKSIQMRTKKTVVIIGEEHNFRPQSLDLLEGILKLLPAKVAVAVAEERPDDITLDDLRGSFQQGPKHSVYPFMDQKGWAYFPIDNAQSLLRIPSETNRERRKEFATRERHMLSKLPMLANFTVLFIVCGWSHVATVASHYSRASIVLAESPECGEWRRTKPEWEANRQTVYYHSALEKSLQLAATRGIKSTAREILTRVSFSVTQ